MAMISAKTRSGLGPLLISAQMPRQMRFLGMLYTIAVILVVLWLVGWLGFHLMGGLIHILLVLAVIAIIVAVVKRV